MNNHFFKKKIFVTNKAFNVIRLCLLTMQDKQEVEEPVKPIDRPELDDDLLYQMTLMILQLFLKPLQVSWDASMFEVYNDNFPLYIKHENISEIAQDG